MKPLIFSLLAFTFFLLPSAAQSAAQKRTQVVEPQAPPCGVSYFITDWGVHGKVYTSIVNRELQGMGYTPSNKSEADIVISMTPTFKQRFSVSRWLDYNDRIVTTSYINISTLKLHIYSKRRDTLVTELSSTSSKRHDRYDKHPAGLTVYKSSINRFADTKEISYEGNISNPDYSFIESLKAALRDFPDCSQIELSNY